jgi:multidrug efflux pump subunit AcrA (membrane-fusion protein)
VSAVTVHPERVVLTTELPGRTAAYLVADVRPQVSGLLQERLFAEGANVKAGSVLYRIDPAPYQAAHDQAKAALAVAEANLPATRARPAPQGKRRDPRSAGGLRRRGRPFSGGGERRLGGPRWSARITWRTRP